MQNKTDLSAVEEIIDRVGCEERHIVTILQEVQDRYHYLPREAFRLIASRLGVGEARLYSVATFYDNFSVEPKGKYVIKVCDGTACHVRNNMPVLDRLREELGLSESKKTTDDLEFTVETVSCLGACGLAPVIMVNSDVYAEMTPDKASEIIRKLKEESGNA